MTTRSTPSKYNAGFTLIEVLVVLVIMSITTTLLIEGLGTTWRNFDKLNNQQLGVNKSVLPKKWFIESLKGAQLYHPYSPVFSGTAQRISFITITPPDAIASVPTKITWTIEDVSSQSQGLFFKTNNNPKVLVASVYGQLSFSFLDGDIWRATFQPDDARVPNAIKIQNNDKQWLFSASGRPPQVKIPPEITLYGKHEI